MICYNCQTANTSSTIRFRMCTQQMICKYTPHIIHMATSPQRESDTYRHITICWTKIFENPIDRNIDEINCHRRLAIFHFCFFAHWKGGAVTGVNVTKARRKRRRWRRRKKRKRRRSRRKKRNEI